MAKFLPSTPDLSAAEEADPRVIGIDSDEGDTMIAALSSATAREVLTSLHDEPTTPSLLAETVDTSLQNVQYHLQKLEAAGLIEEIDTIYSEKGREMSVYAPADRPLVVFAGRDAEATSLKATLSRLFGALGILALVSVFVETLARPGGLSFGALSGGGATGGDGRGYDGQAVELQAEATRTAADAASTGIPPGLLFFAGGTLVLLAVFGIWYLRRR